MEKVEVWFFLIGLALTGAGGLFFWWLLYERPESPFSPEQTMHLDGWDIHYRIEGQGPPLMMLHGIGASLHAWSELAPLLAKHFQVITPDLPGFGQSSKLVNEKYGLDEQAERLEKFLNALNIKSCFLAGNSMGGNIALWLARRDPSRFPKVAVISPAASPGLVPTGARRISFLSGLASWMFPRALAKWMHRQTRGLPERLSEDHVSQTLNVYRKNPDAIRTFLQATDAINDERIATEIFHSKVLVLYGERDRVVPRWTIDGLVTRLPDATLVTHPLGGHQLQHDIPEWAESKMTEFFTSTRLDRTNGQLSHR